MNRLIVVLSILCCLFVFSCKSTKQNDSGNLLVMRFDRGDKEAVDEERQERRAERRDCSVERGDEQRPARGSFETYELDLSSPNLFYEAEEWNPEGWKKVGGNDRVPAEVVEVQGQRCAVIRYDNALSHYREYLEVSDPAHNPGDIAIWELRSDLSSYPVWSASRTKIQFKVVLKAVTGSDYCHLTCRFIFLLCDERGNYLGKDFFTERVDIPESFAELNVTENVGVFRNFTQPSILGSYLKDSLNSLSRATGQRRFIIRPALQIVGWQNKYREGTVYIKKLTLSITKD